MSPAPNPGATPMAPSCIATARTRPSLRRLVRLPASYAPSRHFHPHGPARGADRGRAFIDGHVPAVAAGHWARPERLDTAGATHHLGLPRRLCLRPDPLRAGVRPAWPEARTTRSGGAVLRCDDRLHARDVDR